MSSFVANTANQPRSRTPSNGSSKTRNISSGNVRNSKHKPSSNVSRTLRISTYVSSASVISTPQQIVNLNTNVALTVVTSDTIDSCMQLHQKRRISQQRSLHHQTCLQFSSGHLQLIEVVVSNPHSNKRQTVVALCDSGSTVSG